jgi:cardiolipin synthase
MSARDELTRLRAWTAVPKPSFVGGNQVQLLEGGDVLFPRMCAAIDAAQHDVWLATYIFHDDPAAQCIVRSLREAAARGVAVHVVVDGFGSKATLPLLRQNLEGAGVQLEVFRPLERWYAWLQPGQLRRLHQKLCVCDETVAFVGGINIIDDRHDMNHGWTEAPRLDFAVEVHGPLAAGVHATARAMWARAHLARAWREEVRTLVRGARPARQALDLLRQLRGAAALPEGHRTKQEEQPPMRAAFIVRDNLRQRRAIERSYVEAIRKATRRVDIAVPYFYPGRSFRRALRHAARRGVQVRLLMQGKVDYRIAALAARALYDELQGNGVRIFEYTPAFLHAKVALVDDDWATVGSSNIDPLSLLLNLEANVVVRDPDFSRSLAARFDAAFAVSREVKPGVAVEGVDGQPVEPNQLGRAGWRSWARRAAVAWVANVYLRLAGITGRY